MIRTVTDETTDALAALRDIEQETARWRQHIERMQANPESAAFTYQAVNSGKIVEALVADALKFTRALRCVEIQRSSDPLPALRADSTDQHGSYGSDLR